jgi:hypothetical protein
VNEPRPVRATPHAFDSEHRTRAHGQEHAAEAIRRAGEGAREALLEASRPGQELVEALAQMHAALDASLSAATDDVNETCARLEELARELEDSLGLASPDPDSAPPGPEGAGEEPAPDEVGVRIETMRDGVVAVLSKASPAGEVEARPEEARSGRAHRARRRSRAAGASGRSSR